MWGLAKKHQEAGEYLQVYLKLSHNALLQSTSTATHEAYIRKDRK